MRIAILCITLLAFSSTALGEDAGAPAVKKSEQGICHERGSPTYKRTTHFEPYDTVGACLASGGRLPKNARASGADDAARADGSIWPRGMGGKIAAILGMLLIVVSAYFLSRRRAGNRRD